MNIKKSIIPAQKRPNFLKCDKKKKIKKFIAPKLMIIETSGWRHLKEKNKLFLIKKCIIPAQNRLNFLKLSQIENGKLYSSPTFQKVESRNSTFFQLNKLNLH